MMTLARLLDAVDALRVERRGVAAESYWTLLRQIATRPDGLVAAELRERLSDCMGTLALTRAEVLADFDLLVEETGLRVAGQSAKISERLREINDRYTALCHERSVEDVRRERLARQAPAAAEPRPGA